MNQELALTVALIVLTLLPQKSHESRWAEMTCWLILTPTVINLARPGCFPHVEKKTSAAVCPDNGRGCCVLAVRWMAVCWFFLLVWSPSVGDIDGCGVEWAEEAVPISTLLRISDLGFASRDGSVTAAITTLLVELLHTHRASSVFGWCFSRLDHLLDWLSWVPDTVFGPAMVSVSVRETCHGCVQNSDRLS